MNKKENLFLVQYEGLIEEKELNWGYKDRYFGEDKMPVLFIYSNFPQAETTNKQHLMGIIRTHMEERKGIVFFPAQMVEDVKEFFREAIKKERLEMDFQTNTEIEYTHEYLSQIVKTCFSVTNIKMKEVIKIESPQTQQIKKLPEKQKIEGNETGNNMKTFEKGIISKIETVDMIEFVDKTIPGSLSYLLIKDGKMIESKNISAPSAELNKFILATRLSSVLLSSFPGIHRDLKDKKVVNVTFYDKYGGKIILTKQLKDNKGKWDLFFLCSESELDEVKKAIKDLDKK